MAADPTQGRCSYRCVRKAEYVTARIKITVSGETGVGKSTVCNRFVTGKPSRDGAGQRDQPFETGRGHAQCTEETKCVQGPLLGERGQPEIGIIDTPGLNDPRGCTFDDKNMKMTCETLRKVGSVKCIVFIKRTECRVSGTQRQLMRCLKNSIPYLVAERARLTRDGRKNGSLKIVVNHWMFRAMNKYSPTKEGYVTNFRNVLCIPEAQNGIGLTRAQADQVQFYFVDAQASPGDAGYEPTQSALKQLISDASDLPDLDTTRCTEQPVNKELHDAVVKANNAMAAKAEAEEFAAEESARADREKARADAGNIFNFLARAVVAIGTAGLSEVIPAVVDGVVSALS